RFLFAAYHYLTTDADLSVLDSFKDKNQIADYAKDSIALLVEEGLTKGSNNSINPSGTTTRAEAAVFLYKVYCLN
ncbi:MAG TPA: hypothetical protein DDZ89_18765, partial [Clostridiales bacterium]|nr:hypothetical protein [Clostridiales bacterium]